MNATNQSMSAGIGAFIAFFVLALALWLLIRNMNVRLRNMRYQRELEANEGNEENTDRPQASQDESPKDSSPQR